MSSECDKGSLKWFKCKSILPEKNNRFLGYCHNDYDSSSWEGIVEVWFCPETGWRRCENRDEKPVRVLYWAEMPETPNKD